MAFYYLCLVAHSLYFAIMFSFFNFIFQILDKNFISNEYALKLHYLRRCYVESFFVPYLSSEYKLSKLILKDISSYSQALSTNL